MYDYNLWLKFHEVYEEGILLNLWEQQTKLGKTSLSFQDWKEENKERKGELIYGKAN